MERDKIIKQKKTLFLLVGALFLGFFLFPFKPQKENKEENLCQDVIEYLVAPESYSFDTTNNEEINEFYKVFRDKYYCNFSFDEINMPISTYSRQHYTVIKNLDIKAVRWVDFLVEESEPPQYLSYRPQKTLLAKMSYTYIDNNGIEHPVISRYIIAFLNDEIVYFKGVRGDDSKEKNIMTYVVETEKARLGL